MKSNKSAEIYAKQKQKYFSDEIIYVEQIWTCLTLSNIDWSTKLSCLTYLDIDYGVKKVLLEKKKFPHRNMNYV